MDNYFVKLNSINVNEHTEQKNGLTYLSWAWAWAEIKKAYPEAFYTIYENKDGWNYHTDGKTAWVKTGVTIEGIEMVEYLPVMDFKNKSIPVEQLTSFDVNKAIQRSLTKAVARHGLGLYIYAGEDLPDAADEDKRPAPSKPAPQPAREPKPIDIDMLNKYIIGHAQGKKTKSGKTFRQGYIDAFFPTKEMIETFDAAVADYKTENGLL